MKKLYLLFMVSIFIFVTGCSTTRTADDEFVRLAENYIEQMLQHNPEYATYLGDHRFDDQLNDYSIEAIQKERSYVQAYLDSLSGLDVDQLSEINRVDYDILMHNLKQQIFQIDTLKEYSWNPLQYNIGNGIYMLIAREFAPLEERLQSVTGRLEDIPIVLEQAKANLQNPPKVHTETAILQNSGNLGLVRDELQHFVDKIPEVEAKIKPARDKAVEALTAYGAWLEEELLPQSNGEFRIGETLYRKKLFYTLNSNLSKEDILAKAQDDLVDTQNALYETALPIYTTTITTASNDPKKNDKKYVIRMVLDKLSEARPSNATIVDEAKQTLETTTAFVREHDIVTVPDEPIKIIVMPEFQRGIAVAYCDPPGALEPEGQTFYAISPTPADWSQERIESFFREYNSFMLQNLTIHEAMPGHYLQLAHSNKFKAPTNIRAIFWSGPFVEGWATYAEQVMVELGYGGSEVKMQQLKMRLRLLINAIIDQKIHTEGMTEQEAMTLMMEEGFQEEGEASGKWRRACMTSTQLSTYYVGNLQLNDIRIAYEREHGPDINLREMHDAMLSFGSPPAKYVKQLMGL